jgi:hypothetical protein
MISTRRAILSNISILMPARYYLILYRSFHVFGEPKFFYIIGAHPSWTLYRYSDILILTDWFSNVNPFYRYTDIVL